MMWNLDSIWSDWINCDAGCCGYSFLCLQVCCLDGLARFVALGMLDLSCNNVDWPELRKIRHMHIMHLHVQGNPKLDKDPYCMGNFHRDSWLSHKKGSSVCLDRYHLIDIFPHVWMLDGLMVTGRHKGVGSACYTWSGNSAIVALSCTVPELHLCAFGTSPDFCIFWKLKIQ